MIDDLIAGRISPPSSESTITVINSDAYTAYAADDTQSTPETTELPLLPHGNGNSHGNGGNSVSKTDTPCIFAFSSAGYITGRYFRHYIQRRCIYRNRHGLPSRNLVVEVVIEKRYDNKCYCYQPQREKRTILGCPGSAYSPADRRSAVYRR